VLSAEIANAGLPKESILHSSASVGWLVMENEAFAIFQTKRILNN
jgi:hypothetical protein